MFGDATQVCSWTRSNGSIRWCDNISAAVMRCLIFKPLIFSFMQRDVVCQAAVFFGNLDLFCLRCENMKCQVSCHKAVSAIPFCGRLKQSRQNKVEFLTRNNPMPRLDLKFRLKMQLILGAYLSVKIPSKIPRMFLQNAYNTMKPISMCSYKYSFWILLKARHGL